MAEAHFQLPFILRKDIAGKGSSTSCSDIVLESLFFCVLQIFSHVAQKLPFLVCCVAHTVEVLVYVVLVPHLQGPSCYTWCFDQESWFSLLSGIATNQQASGIAKNYLELRHGLVQVASTNNATCCVALRGSGGWIARHLGLRTPLPL